jgi:hypothetical protein
MEYHNNLDSWITVDVEDEIITFITDLNHSNEKTKGKSSSLSFSNTQYMIYFLIYKCRDVSWRRNDYHEFMNHHQSMPRTKQGFLAMNMKNKTWKQSFSTNYEPLRLVMLKLLRPGSKPKNAMKSRKFNGYNEKLMR